MISNTYPGIQVLDFLQLTNFVSSFYVPKYCKRKQQQNKTKHQAINYENSSNIN